MMKRIPLRHVALIIPISPGHKVHIGPASQARGGFITLCGKKGTPQVRLWRLYTDEFHDDDVCSECWRGALIVHSDFSVELAALAAHPPAIMVPPPVKPWHHRLRDHLQRLVRP